MAMPGMPPRWRDAHDCDRPARWREALDEEDCKSWRLFSCRDNPDAEECMVFEAETPKRSVAYTDLVPNLYTLEQVLEAQAYSSQRGKLTVIKFYSKSCRACLRIAAKYRRVALDFEDKLDCMEISDNVESRAVFDALGVTQVPSVQIFDGSTRIGKFSAMGGKEWKIVDAKLRLAMQGLTHRRLLHKLAGEQPLPDGRYESDLVVYATSGGQLVEQKATEKPRSQLHDPPPLKI